MLDLVFHQRIEGSSGKFNDVYISKPTTSEAVQQIVVFFPGDVQVCCVFCLGYGKCMFNLTVRTWLQYFKIYF